MPLIIHYKTPLLIVILLINLFGFILMYQDKKKAKRHQYRIPEMTLWLVTIFFGGIGTSLGMWIFHHKNNKLHFVIGFSILSLAQVIGLCYILGMSIGG